MNPKTLLRIPAALLFVCLWGACRRSADPEIAVPAVPEALQAVFRPVAVPEPLIPLTALRQSAVAGDRVVFEAKVMGAATPFVNNRAVMVVGDDAVLTSCDITHEDDSCPTPWDLCCDDPALIRGGTATVQVVDPDGNVLRHGLKGIQALKELSRVRIEGEVDPMSTAGTFVVNVTAIEVLKTGPAFGE